MQIKHFAVRNFKIHRETSVDLYPITVFVGPNGGGKSSLFDALINFSVVSRGPLSEAFSQWPHSFEAHRHHGSLATARISYQAVLKASAGAELDYSIAFSDTGSSLMIHEERLRSQGEDLLLFDRSKDVCNLNDVASYLDHDLGILAALRRAHRGHGFVESHAAASECARRVSRIGRYRLDPAKLRQPSIIVDPPNDDASPVRTPRVDYSGEGLAAALYFLHETNAPELQRITEEAARALRGFSGFDFNRVGNDRVGFSVRFADSRKVITAANLSDGSLSVIGWLTLALSPDPPSVLCAEEPENGMTPRAVGVVYENLRRLATGANPTSQVLLSSHSPFVITKAWNGADRDFIYQCYPKDGVCQVQKFGDVVKDAGMLRSGGELGLALAEQVMDGFRGP